MTIHDYYGQKNGLLVLSMFLFYFVQDSYII